jgi:beta-glucuronidase
VVSTIDNRKGIRMASELKDELPPISRRKFLHRSSHLAAAAALALPEDHQTATPALSGNHERVSLNGWWRFRLDPQTEGEKNRWFAPDLSLQGWQDVCVPHTWQVTPESAEYYGVAWYRRSFDVPRQWEAGAVRVEFEAVFHSATVWVNGVEAGKHLGKGYTAFTFDLNRLLKFGAENTIAVRVDNAFNESMLPRGRSSDWAHDGGIYRPVTLLITPQVFIENVWVDAAPNLAQGSASLEVTVVIRNTGTRPWQGRAGFTVREAASGTKALEQLRAATARVDPGQTRTVSLPAATLTGAKLWHFDHPNLYVIDVEIGAAEGTTHTYTTHFGVRLIEAKNGSFYLNGERVRLMGVERMAGSNPELGMAEPEPWLIHDHDDMKSLNCVYTRVHWPQDRRVLDYCDRHGILIQTEVPTWGPKTFAGMGPEPDPLLMQNGLEQLREMIARDRNHPSIFSWGVCNEIGGQNPPAYAFAKRMYEEAKRLDPRRLVTYASNSLQKTPEKDVAGVMDYIMWNEYYESWYKGTPADLARNLDEIHQAFPDKAIVISEYGYCACTADRPEGDARRVEILRAHNRVFREREFIAGLIFFCYNDYRTHVGDRGLGPLRQRVHGVVDLYGARKPSYEVLRGESSPIERVEVQGHPDSFSVTVQARKSVPAYPLRGYSLRAVLYGYGEIPLERNEVALAQLDPGEKITVPVRFTQKEPLYVRFDVMRPTGFSAFTRLWKA